MRIGTNGIILGIAVGDTTNMTSKQIDTARGELEKKLDGITEKSKLTSDGAAEGFTGAAGDKK